MEYKIIVETVQGEATTSINPIEQQEIVDKKVKQKEQKPKDDGQNDVLKTAAKVVFTYGVSQQAAGLAVQSISQSYQLRGETLKAQRLNTSYSNLAQNASLGLGIGVTLLTGNPLGIAMSAFQLAQRTYQLVLETQRFAVERGKDQYRSQYLSQRLVRNISEVR